MYNAYFIYKIYKLYLVNIFYNLLQFYTKKKKKDKDNTSKPRLYNLIIFPKIFIR